MRKVIAIVSEDLKLVEINNRHEKAHAHFRQKIEFLEKQVHDAEEAYQKDAERLKTEIEDRLRETKKLPSDYNVDTHHIHVDTEVGAIFTCPNDSHNKSNPIDDMLKNLFKK